MSIYYREYTFPFLFSSDDGDRYDSENEGGSHTRRGREYKDKDSDSLDSAEKREHSSKPSTPARTKPTTSVKKIDLGAAAHYGRGSNSLVSYKSRYKIPVCFFTL